MENDSIEMSLLDPETQELVAYIANLIPAEDKAGLTDGDILYVLDRMDDFLMEKGLMQEDGDDVTYLDGEIDETEQLDFVLAAAQKEHRTISSVQVQLIMDAELQYGIEKGYYEEEED